MLELREVTLIDKVKGEVGWARNMDRTFARLSIVAAILFLVIVLALMFLAPEVDALKYGISFYALTDFRAAIGVAIALVGLSALWPHVSVAGRVGTALLIGWGMLSMPASIFPLDPPGSVPTLSGTIHNIALSAAFLAADAAEPVRMTHLLAATRAEYAKLDRPLTGTEVTGWTT